MRGSKAKKLRKLAGVSSKENQDRSYYGQEHTVRRKVIKNLAGEVTHRYQTATFKLNPCTRLAYKMLKAHYVKLQRACLPSSHKNLGAN